VIEIKGFYTYPYLQRKKTETKIKCQRAEEGMGRGTERNDYIMT
jgi:hypothetical protein